MVSPSGSGVAPANGIQIAYETFGERGGRPLIMVMGLGASMLMWHPDLCTMLAGHGFFVIRFDNRDVGRSSHLHDARPPDLMAALMRGEVLGDRTRLQRRGGLDRLERGLAHREPPRLFSAASAGGSD